MTPEKEQAFIVKGRINSLASCGAYVAADRLFDASLDACRHYCLEGTVHATGLAGGFDSACGLTLTIIQLILPDTPST